MDPRLKESRQAASKISDVREDIFDFISSISQSLAQVNDYSTLYDYPSGKARERLHAGVISLYPVILNGLEHVLKWLTQKAAGNLLQY